MGSIGSSPYSSVDAVAALTQQLKLRDASNVSAFQAYVTDVPKETIAAARYIGDLRPDQNRLNTFSLASRGDTQDYYRFNLKSAGNVHFSMLVDQLDAQRQVVQSETATGLGVQLIQYQGLSPKVIADSDPGAGAANQMYNQLVSDGARLAAGKYVVRVYREADTSPHTEFFYSFQLVGDRYSQDYDTMQQEAPAHPTVPAIQTMTMDPAVTLMAGSMDSTLGTAMAAAIQPPVLTPSGDTSTDPAVQLLNTFM